jgi:hypothetical protein
MRLTIDIPRPLDARTFARQSAEFGLPIKSARIARGNMAPDERKWGGWTCRIHAISQDCPELWAAGGVACSERAAADQGKKA